MEGEGMRAVTAVEVEEVTPLVSPLLRRIDEGVTVPLGLGE
jgi:hypothetical protein